MRKRVGYKQVATDEEEDEPMTADKVAEANGMVYSDGIWVKPGIEAALRNQKMDYKKARENVLKATLQRELEECKERERRTEIASWEQIKCGLIVFVIVLLAASCMATATLPVGCACARTRAHRRAHF